MNWIFRAHPAKSSSVTSMKQNVVTEAHQIWSSFRHVLRVATAIVGLVIASLCADMPMPELGDAPEAPCADESSSESSAPPEPDSQDSNDLVDDVNENALLSIGPPSHKKACILDLLGGALAGFGTRLPRPSGV
jgi:hypothetical protein